jgi:hypothetical protein
VGNGYPYAETWESEIDVEIYSDLLVLLILRKRMIQMRMRNRRLMH